MSMHRTRRRGLVVCAIALLLAGCSGSGGSDSGTSPIPRGMGGGHHGHKGGKHHHGKGGMDHHGKGGRHHHQGGNGPSASGTAPGGRPAHSTAPATGHSSSRPHVQPSRSSTHSSATSQPPSPGGPTVTVSPHGGLHDGQTVTVAGSGFSPHTTLVVAQCLDRGQSTNQSDCNVHVNLVTGSYGAAKKVVSDSNGHVGPVQLVVAKSFKSVNCATQKCLIAISEPTLRPDPADEGDHYITFA
jgi:neocarzinostatin family protein